MNLENWMREQQMAHEKEIGTINSNQDPKIEKVEMIWSLTQNKFLSKIDKKTKNPIALNHFRDVGKSEGEKIHLKQFKSQSKQLQSHSEKECLKLDHQIQGKKTQLKTIQDEFERKSNQLDQRKADGELELNKLYTLIMREAEIVRRVENGFYSQGLMNQKIAMKPDLPTKDDYPYLF